MPERVYFPGLTQKRISVICCNSQPSGETTTVNVLNSDSDIIGSVTVPCGTTSSVNIADTEINQSDGTPITTTPATVPYNVPDSVITVEYNDGTPISTTNVKATDAATIVVPDPPVCLDGTSNLEDQFGNSLGSVVVASGATQNNTINLPCASFKSFTDQFGKANAFAVMATFGTVTNQSRGLGVNGNFIYLTNSNNVVKINATTFANVAAITGFGTAQEIAFSPDGSQYAVINGTGNSVRIMDTATDTQIVSFPCITSPWSISYNDTGTEVLVAAFSTTSITRYDLVGNTLGTVMGFDGVIFDIRRVGLNYHVLTATGVVAGNTQRVRVLDFATNTEVSSHSLGTVTAIGICRSLVIEGSVAWITTERNSGLLIYEYDLTFALVRSQNLGLISGGVAYGLAYNANTVCPSLVATLPSVLTAVSIKI